MDNWPLPDSLLEKIQLPSSGAEVTVRLDGSEYAMAQEASGYTSALPADPVANYLAQEMGTMTEAFQRGTHAAIHSDMLASSVFGRLVVESAIRMVWLATESDDEEATKVRLGRLEKRDLSQMLAASAAIDDLATLGPLLENANELKASIVESVPQAPDLRSMVQESGPVGLYAVYRYMATATHPGIGSRANISRSMEPDGMRVVLRFAFSLAMISVAAVIKILLGVEFADRLRINLYMMRTHGSPPRDVGKGDDETRRSTFES